MLYWVNFSSDCKSNISDRRPSATSLRYPDHSEPASQYWTAKESLSSCPACTYSQSTYLPSGHILRTSLYLLFIYSEIIPELTSILSAIVHFSQSASFVASASYRQLQAQPHFIFNIKISTL